MVSSYLLFVLSFVLCANGLEKRAPTFSFSYYHANHMVLQRGPLGATVWGYSPKHGDKVDLYVNSNLTGHATVDSHGVWQGIVHNPGGNHANTVTAVSSLGNITLQDVWFGDVWLCSGQSNMAFTVSELTNATEEEQVASHYKNIRMFKASNVYASTPHDEFLPKAGLDHWSLPNAATVKFFSAVCWLFGKYLSTHVDYPIGLLESDWGGTPIEAWSSPAALSKCNSTIPHQSPTPVTSHSNSALWNGMMHPFLKATIFGALWYQGEANSGNARDYACRFPAMIDDWRSQFHKASLQTSDPTFPFGFVQLAPNRNTSVVGHFPDVRWAQTANYGQVPNSRLHNVFMALALDLPDFHSPHGTIHPRLKHDVADRLVLAALGVAYKKADIDYQGPYPSSYTLQSTTHSVIIEYDSGRKPIEVRNNNGFQVCCTTHNTICHAYSADVGWINAPIKHHDTSTVTLDVSKCNLATHTIGGIRYEWSESPCDFKHCAIYGADNDLPGAPFIHSALLH